VSSTQFTGELLNSLCTTAGSICAWITNHFFIVPSRQENVQYGWEFPSQLLVIVIVFTYAVICPVILPVGMLYFVGSLIVYKKQVLYVYTPLYESGGSLFSDAVQRTLFGLVCGQLTLLGYFLVRGCRYQTILLIPLPVFTVYGMQYFRNHYADPSKLLSMERAREYDRISELDDEGASGSVSSGLLGSPGSPKNGLESRKVNFDKNSYRQPVLTERVIEPLPYRRGRDDEMTVQTRELLRRIRGLAEDQAHHQRGSRNGSPKLGGMLA
jgi:Calcium-dependent channel, 7TM region, putative phosphate